MKHPIPSRTRKLSMVAPMVLQLKLWESRSSPILDRIINISQYDNKKYKQHKLNCSWWRQQLLALGLKYIKLIVHAGAHKTASTHLQNRLLENESLFVKSGCYYLGSEKIRDEFGTLWYALGRSDTPDEQKRKLAALAAEIGRAHVWTPVT